MTVELCLHHRLPFDAAGLLAYLEARAIPGVEALDRATATYRRVLDLPHGPGVAALRPERDQIACRLRLSDPRDADAAVVRCRRLLGLDADPAAVVAALGDDPLIGALVRAAPGRRVPGAVDGAELAVRAVIGQQVSVAGARTVGGRLAASLGVPLQEPFDGLVRAFPTAAALAGADPEQLPMPRARARALTGLARALAGGDVVLDPTADPADRAAARAALLALPGIGPWTVEYVAMRALGDPDAFPGTDLVLRKALVRLGHADDARAIGATAERWRPWRAYAAQHLWSSAHAAPP
jgi:AraC family transcriptional regulator of adaptative response / DNA-3-methyladenine glycosylase II